VRGALLSVELIELKSGLLSKSYTLCTKISCEKPRPLSFTLSKTSKTTQDPGQAKLSALYQISTNDEQRLQELLSSHHEDLLLLQPSTFISDSHGVSLVLPGVILNIDPLERAAHLIAEVCFDEDVPYR
jgi:hypothetical protein